MMNVNLRSFILAVSLSLCMKSQGGGIVLWDYKTMKAPAVSLSEAVSLVEKVLSKNFEGSYILKVSVNAGNQDGSNGVWNFEVIDREKKKFYMHVRFPDGEILMLRETDVTYVEFNEDFEMLVPDENSLRDADPFALEENEKK